MTKQSDTRAHGRGFAAGLRIVSFLAVGVVLAAMPSLAAPFGYVANTGSGTVSVIDAATNTVVATIPAGPFLGEVAVNPDGAYAYVTNGTEDGSPGSVTVIATATNTVVATIPVGISPYAVAVSPDGAHAYVINGDNTTSVIATATNTVVATIPGVGGISVAFNPDGKHAYVANNSGSVAVIDTASNTVVTSIPISDLTPWAVAVTPDGARLYVVGDCTLIDVIDTVSYAELAQIQAQGTIGPDDAATEVAISPDGSHAYVNDLFDQTVLVIATATNTVVATIPAGPFPTAVAITPDAAHVYATNGDGTVSAIDTTTNTVVATIQVGWNSDAIAFAPLISVPSSGTTCNGTYNGAFKGNITVSAGQNCKWVGGEITGSLLVTGGNLATTNGAITGSVVIGGASTFSLGPGTTINGSVAIGLIPSGTATNQICGANVLGDVAVAGSDSPFQFGSNTPASCPGNTIGGSATIDLNTAPVTIYDNSIAKSLSCVGDRSITGGGNTAAHKLGQCSAF